MLQCPVCGTTYTDTSLRYCLTDRAQLAPVEQETVVRSVNPVRVDIPRATEVASAFRAPAVEEKKGGFPIFKVLLAVVGLGIVVVGAVGMIGAFFYFNSRGNDSNQNGKNSSNSPSATPTLDPDRQRLQDQIANMQKQLDEQKNANRSAKPPGFPTPDNQSNPGVVTARVNSPADGFLALRSAPSSDYGDRIAKLPHGSVVTIENCERERVKIGNRTGRWCMVAWSGYDGWVFDAWLDY